ncbi:MAG: hypothetical protein KGQ51_19435 [Planctomycetes bacterium]|nr:hypothetical protein [Planctomycetota bacterium]
MTKLSRMQRNLWVWTVPVLLGGVVYIAVVYGASLLVAQELKPSFIPPRVSPATEDLPGGGMMGSMGGMSPTITWVKPAGEKPDWLTRGEKSLRAREEMRRRLDKEGEFQFNNQPLSSVVTFISDQYGLPVHIDEKGLEQETLTPEERITIKTNGSLRSCLRRILDPSSLDYVVHENGLEITNRLEAIGNGAVLAYNLAHVASNSSQGDDIVNTIKKMVRPDAWDDQGGGASCHLIGSVLIVKASEGMHEEIERFLSLLNEKRPKDNKAYSRDPFGE